jgi:hypothetical protein
MKYKRNVFDKIKGNTLRGWTRSYTGGAKRGKQRSERSGWDSGLLILIFQAVCALRGRKPWHATYGDVYFTVEVLRRYP